MDLNKTGQFIANQRNQKHITQKELAQKIGVTDKAVSRWETGRGFPDVSILKVLADVLNVSITEIVNGGKIMPEDIEEKSDKAIIEALYYAKGMSKKVIGVLLLIAGFGLIIYPNFVTGMGCVILPIIGVMLFIAGIIVLSYKKIRSRGKEMKISKHLAGIISFILMALTIILEILPYGAVLIFAPGPETRIKQTFSYFSLTPFGYANIFPFLTAILTVIVTILILITILKKMNITWLKNTAYVCTVVALIFSIIPILMFGTEYMTTIGIFITILLLTSLIFQALSNRKQKQ